MNPFVIYRSLFITEIGKPFIFTALTCINQQCHAEEWVIIVQNDRADVIRSTTPAQYPAIAPISRKEQFELAKGELTKWRSEQIADNAFAQVHLLEWDEITMPVELIHHINNYNLFSEKLEYIINNTSSPELQAFLIQALNVAGEHN